MTSHQLATKDLMKLLNTQNNTPLRKDLPQDRIETNQATPLTTS